MGNGHAYTCTARRTTTGEPSSDTTLSSTVTARTVPCADIGSDFLPAERGALESLDTQPASYGNLGLP